MPVEAAAEIEIDCPRVLVAAYASDPDNTPAWNKAVRAVEWKGLKSLRVGSQFAIVELDGARRSRSTFEVREVTPDERFVIGTTEGPYPIEIAYTWRDTTSGGTSMEVCTSIEPEGLSDSATAGIVAGIRVLTGRNLVRLKALLESRDANPEISGLADVTPTASTAAKQQINQTVPPSDSELAELKARWVESVRPILAMTPQAQRDEVRTALLHTMEAGGWAREEAAKILNDLLP